MKEVLNRGCRPPGRELSFLRRKLSGKPVERNLHEAEVRPIRIREKGPRLLASRVHRSLRSLGAERVPVAVHRVRVLCVHVGGVTNVEAEPQTYISWMEKWIAHVIDKDPNQNNGKGKRER